MSATLERSDEQRAFVEAIRDFAQREAGTREQRDALSHDRTELHNQELYEKVAELGWVGVQIPEEHGGGGGSVVDLCLMLEETSHGLLPLGGMSVSLITAGAIERFGSDAQKEELLAAVCNGKVQSIAMSEPEAGSDVGNLACRAQRDNGSYVINGQKTWISLIDHCDWIVTFATLEKGGGRDKICAFIIGADTPGVTRAPFKNKLGFRPAASGDVFLEDVVVPAEDRLGEEGQGYSVAMSAVETGRLGVASRALGIAQDCLDRSVEYARERIVQGQEIGRFQLVQSMITDMVVGIEGARAMTRDYAEMRDAGDRARREASLAKMHASDVAMMASTHACQIHGAYGAHEDYHVGRHFRDAKVFQVVEGQNQLHRVMVAEYALGYRG
jgi:alkylation response protein AidB-like acyl-CoA dehydrogenase